MDKSELAIATSQIQNPIPFLIELLFNLLSQMITVSTIKLTSQPVRFYRINLFNLLAQNSNDNSCIFLYYMPEVPNVG
jgi:hypothetical protein